VSLLHATDITILLILSPGISIWPYILLDNIEDRGTYIWLHEMSTWIHQYPIIDLLLPLHTSLVKLQY
jgi:hypothetical protein